MFRKEVVLPEVSQVITLQPIIDWRFRILPMDDGVHSEPNISVKDKVFSHRVDGMVPSRELTPELTLEALKEFSVYVGGKRVTAYPSELKHEKKIVFELSSTGVIVAAIKHPIKVTRDPILAIRFPDSADVPKRLPRKRKPKKMLTRRNKE